MSYNEIAVVGAGVVGICAATYLAESGQRVVLFDRTGVCEETSSGNAAALAFSDVLPLVQKGMMRKLPQWLKDPLGPLSIPPAYLPKLMPWLWRFWRASADEHYEASLSAQTALMGVAEREWMALINRSGTRAMLNEHGSLDLYESQAEFAAELPGWEAKARHGIEFRHLDMEEAAEIQPGLSPSFVRATFVPGWKNVSDPKLFSKAIYAYAETTGRVLFDRKTITGIVPGVQGAAVRFDDGGSEDFKAVVVCAGAWSKNLAAQLGDRVPLETERGYNTTLPPGAFDVRCQLIFPAHGFVITPLSTGLRVGGAVELGGLKRPPNYARSRAMLEKAKRFLPGLRAEGGGEWMGYRPSLPDSLPVIGKSTASPYVTYAFGHGHLGLTQAAATGALVRDLVLGRTPPISLDPYSPQRF